MTLYELIQSLLAKGVLRSSRIKSAFKRVDRKTFIPEEYADLAYDDVPMPIGEGQTISQPYTVAFMLELLEPKEGERIMDIGSGSGWQTALLAEIVGAKGRIHAIEVVPFLCKLGGKNLAQFPELQNRVELFCRNAAEGLPAVAEQIGGFDGIIAAADVPDVPEAWRRQLKTGGRLVYPKSGAIFLETKKEDNTFRVESYPGFAFVPFV
jgi:protein-L-isoaspartate(D-aspartate) O-methyltransferase